LKVFNVIWGFSLGAGIDKCFLSYSLLGNIDRSIEVFSVCITKANSGADFKSLDRVGAEIIVINDNADFSWIKSFSSIVKTRKPDVIFTHGFNGAIAMSIVKMLNNDETPLICSYHGPYHAPSVLKKFIGPVYNSLISFIYKKVAERVICVSEKSRSDLIKKGIQKEKICVVHNGIRPNDLFYKISLNNFGLNPKITTLVSVSSLFLVKGLQHLFQALRILVNRSNIEFQYAVIGDGPEKEFLVKLAEELGIKDKIYFLGYQANIQGWLEVVDIYVLPSLSECHSIALLEAMRAGKAIIATDTGGNPESIRNEIDGILVPPGDSIALAGGLEELLSNPEKRITLGKSARSRFFENFTEEAMLLKLANALRL
jgi:glycosyltransferase involved in cell wall biosynthesis